MNKSFRSKVTTAFKWSAFGTISGRSMQFLGEIAVSRFLLPEDFGIIAIGLAVLNISEMLTETGFASALVQKQGNINKLLNTAWSMEVLKGLCLCILLLLFAYPISIFYNDLRLHGVLSAIAILFLVRGCRNIGIVFFRKKLELHKQVFLDIFPYFAQLLIIIPLAYYLNNIWAIVIGIYIRRFVELFLTFNMHPYRPSFKIKINVLMELLEFGKWIFIISIIGAFTKNLIPFFIGKKFDFQTLGYFNRAEIFSILLFSVLIHICWQVAYPMFSMIDKNKLNDLFADSIYLVSYFGFSIASILFLLSEDIVKLFLTNTWLKSIEMMNMLILVGMLSFLSTLNGIILNAFGRPVLTAKIAFYTLIILLILILPFSHYGGIYGLIISMIISSLFNLIYGWKLLSNNLNVKFIKVLFLILHSLINAFFLFMSLLFIKYIFFIKIYLHTFFILLFVGVIIFIIFTFIWYRTIKINNGIFKLIKPFYNS